MRGRGDQGEKDGCSVRAGNWFCASTVASQCRAAGWEVAIVDSCPFGCTCARRGCDPKKVLVDAAEVRDWDRRRKGKGIVANGSRTAWPEMMRFKRSFTGPIVPTWCEPQSRLPDRAAL